VIRLRAATAADADALSRLHADSWRSAYRGMLGEAYLDGDVHAERAAFWQRALSSPPANQHVIVALDGDVLVGFVSLYGDDDPAWGTRIEAVHVAPTRKRQGLGARLMAEAAAWCGRVHPARGIYLHVLQPNVAAQRFYERLGARNAESGVWKALDGGEVPEFRYVWANPQALRDAVSRESG
jgi:ribosomal protein S18 acetylase RimI-like enzyme